jgi:hypothetical protein
VVATKQYRTIISIHKKGGAAACSYHTAVTQNEGGSRGGGRYIKRGRLSRRPLHKAWRRLSRRPLQNRAAQQADYSSYKAIPYYNINTQKGGAAASSYHTAVTQNEGGSRGGGRYIKRGRLSRRTLHKAWRRLSRRPLQVAVTLLPPPIGGFRRETDVTRPFRK